jgi:hypothetical protein
MLLFFCVVAPPLFSFRLFDLAYQLNDRQQPQDNHRDQRDEKNGGCPCVARRQDDNQYQACGSMNDCIFDVVVHDGLNGILKMKNGE